LWKKKVVLGFTLLGWWAVIGLYSLFAKKTSGRYIGFLASNSIVSRGGYYLLYSLHIEIFAVINFTPSVPEETWW
jgi:hypothetical protein